MVLHVRIFIREKGDLCKKALDALYALQKEIPLQVTEINIDLDPDLQKEFGERVPVIRTGPFTLEAPFEDEEIRLHLLSARDSLNQKKEDLGEKFNSLQNKKNNFSKADQFTYWYSKKYLLVINLFLAFYIGIPFLAPILERSGYTDFSRLIYKAYRFTCHQLAFRSFFLFGDQPIYPRETAGIEGYETFFEATEIDERNIIEAQNFIGDDQIGFKVAFCERDLGIFAAMLLYGIYFSITGRKAKQIPFIWVIIIGFIPIGIDGFSQLLPELPFFTLWDLRESTPILRLLTGSILGVMLGRYGYPLFEDTMRQTRTALALKFFSIPEKLDES